MEPKDRRPPGAQRAHRRSIRAARQGRSRLVELARYYDGLAPGVGTSLMRKAISNRTLALRSLVRGQRVQRVTRRASRMSSTRRHTAGIRRSAASRDDGGGGEPPGASLVGLRAARGVTL